MAFEGLQKRTEKYGTLKSPDGLRGAPRERKSSKVFFAFACQTPPSLEPPPIISSGHYARLLVKPLNHDLSKAQSSFHITFLLWNVLNNLLGIYTNETFGVLNSLPKGVGNLMLGGCKTTGCSSCLQEHHSGRPGCCENM